MAYIAAALAKDKKAAAPKGRKPKAAPAVTEINGVEIVEDRPARVPSKKPAPAPKEAPAPKARAPRREIVESDEPPAPRREYPAPSRALALSKTPARPMPHSCNCKLCPLKND